MRAGERGPPLRKTVHKAPFRTQVPSATCGAGEGLRQRPPTRPIGCKISSRPSFTELRKWEIPKRQRIRKKGEKNQEKENKDFSWNCLSFGQAQQENKVKASKPKILNRTLRPFSESFSARKMTLSMAFSQYHFAGFLHHVYTLYANFKLNKVTQGDVCRKKVLDAKSRAVG